VAVPKLAARVTDLTSTLDAQQRAALDGKLAAFEQAKGSQIAVLIVPTTEPETIEQYSIRVTDAWKLGRKGVDDGILIVVARNDRTIRIEVGYGLEGAVPDAIANRIVDETIVPRFKAGDYYGGLDAGITQLIGVIDGEALPPPRTSAAHGGDRVGAVMPLLFFALFGAQFLRRVLGSGLGSVAAGVAVFAIAWLVSGVLLVALFFGVVALLLTLLGIVPLGGFGGGFGGGGWRGGGFGGGGFSGGGGGFGGGGASGRW
ncbi:MAG TPA: TPM domain-containing protein, partial [Solimonas sp.]|nr:TPM domain-containing protein [Solimonas sp.]